jgi:hypothetical protein
MASYASKQNEAQSAFSKWVAFYTFNSPPFTLALRTLSACRSSITRPLTLSSISMASVGVCVFQTLKTYVKQASIASR